MTGSSRVNEFFVTHRKKLIDFVFNYTKNIEEAEDLVQETFIKLLQADEDGLYNEAKGKYSTWVYTIAKNITIDFLRVRNRMKFVRDGENDEGSEYSIFDTINTHHENAEEKLIRKQTNDTVKKLIENLPEQEKVALKSRIYEGDKYKKIAEDNDKPIGTIKANIWKAKNTIKHRLQENPAIQTKNNTIIKRSETRSIKFYNYTLNYLNMSNEKESGNNIKSLRDTLFSALKKMELGEMDANQGRSIAAIGQVIINSAKLQLEYNLTLSNKQSIQMLESDNEINSQSKETPKLSEVNE